MSLSRQDNVLITTAGMQALELVGKVLLEPGATIAAQSPAHLGALDAWPPRAPRYRPMRIGADGVRPASSAGGGAIRLYGAEFLESFGAKRW